MGYLKEVEAWLETLGITAVEAKRAIKEKILESYRNGQRDGRKGGSNPKLASKQKELSPRQ